MVENEFEKYVFQLHSETKWEEIISLYGNEQNNHACRRLLWVWPTLRDLDWIKHIIIEFNLNGIVSIGCGTGLLEWIIQQHSKCTVIGVEFDQYWWESRYSPTLYLDKIIFIEKPDTVINISHDSGIFFCYFNDGKAFEHYMKNYYGKLLLIIGPMEGQNLSTDPLPLDIMKLISFGWTLNKMRKMDNNRDCIAVYTRS